MRGAFIREGAFIGINTVGNKRVLIQPSSIIITCISNVFQHYLLITYYKAVDKWYKPHKGPL